MYYSVSTTVVNEWIFVTLYNYMARGWKLFNSKKRIQNNVFFKIIANLHIVLSVAFAKKLQNSPLSRVLVFPKIMLISREHRSVLEEEDLNLGKKNSYIT